MATSKPETRALRLVSPHRTLRLLLLLPFNGLASRQKEAELQEAEAEEARCSVADEDSSCPTCYCYSTADAEEVKSLVPVKMEKPKKDTILQLIMIWIGIQSVNSLECYDSSYPVPHRRTECGPNMMCYSEYYAVNRSGTIRQYYDRFCVHESHCLYRGIDESCPTLAQLDHKMQSLFTKHHAKSQVNSIRFSEFCCCSTNLCNDVNHKRVYDKYGLQITIADNVFTDASSSRSNIVSLTLLICIISYMVSVF